MRKVKAKRMLALLMCVLLAFSTMPNTVLAEEGSSKTSGYTSETHDVFKHAKSTLAPGIEQYINHAYAKDGKQMVYYVATADITRDDVLVQTSYLNQHENGIMGMEKLTNQIAYANSKYSNPGDEQFISEYYNAVAGVNASFYNMTTGQPMGITYIDGVSFGNNSYDNFFAVLKDGKTAVIDYASNLGNYVDADGNSTIWQAVAGSQWLVRDGADVTANVSGSYNTERHSRTCVGITADGRVVMMVLDGRQEPFSCGGTMHELAQIMLEAGCVAAINLDGGGSTTYAARPEGEDSVKVINRPSDGSERSISAGLIIASTAVPSNTFDHVAIKALEEYMMPGSSTQVTMTGVSPAGTAAEIPQDITYKVVNGTYENGILTSGEAGDVVLTAMYDGREVGSLTVHAVIPDKIAFGNSNITVPFGKTVSINLSASYGLNSVKFQPSDVTFTLENPDIGSISGFDFTAGDGSVTKSEITVRINATDISASAVITLGKGSEVVFDFEDGDVSKFNLGYTPYNYVVPEGKVYSVTAETGKVHSGNGAMALDINYGNSTESGYMMTALQYLGDAESFENATKLGMWMYISDEDVSTWIRYTVFPLVQDDQGNFVKAESTITNTLADGVASTTGFVHQYQEPGWHYLSIDLSAYKGLYLHQGYIVQFYISDRDGEDYNYYYNQHKSYNGRYVMYVDDITIDYSEAVDDREAPVFSNVTYATPAMSDATALNGQTVSDNVFSFGAKVSDNMEKPNHTGLKADTAKAYIDGVEVAVEYNDGIMSVTDVALADGVHHIKFSICDNQGNYASVIRTINVQANSGKPTIKVVAHDPSLDKILLGSVWYADIVATDMEKVHSVTVDIDLNNMSKWELDYMEVAEGFEATYSIQDDENIATIVITRTGNNEIVGEGTLVSLPIRTWELRMGYVYENGNKKGQQAFTYKQFRDMKEFWPIDISMEIDRGIVTFMDGTSDVFTGEGPQVDTESYKMAKDMISTAEGQAYYNAWDGGHIHNAEEISDKIATCVESGYTGRTYCEICSSVVEWGEILPKGAHSYAVVDDVLQCTTCRKCFNGVWSDGCEYINGRIASGWVADSYYQNGHILTGVQFVPAPDNTGEFYYDFGENGICTDRVKYTGIFTKDGKSFFSKMGVLTSGWQSLADENGESYFYYFSKDDYTMCTGVCEIDGLEYTFNDNGHLIRGAFRKTEKGTKYYVAGESWFRRFVTLEEGTYWLDVEGYIAYGNAHTVTTNVKDITWYHFDETTGLMTGKCNGFIDYRGEKYYCDENGKVFYGIIKVNDGIIFTGTRGKVYVNTSCYVDSTTACRGCELETGKYWCDENGYIVKDGFVEIEGSTYYFTDYSRAKGITRIDDAYYIFNLSNGKMAKDATMWVSANDYGLEPGMYYFGTDGKMFIPDLENGTRKVVVENGKQYFTIDGVKMKNGLYELDGEYYFAGYNGALIANAAVYVETKLLSGNGWYAFDNDAKLIKSGFVTGDGKTYYYENGVRAKGFVKLGNDYYIFNASSGMMYKDANMWVPANPYGVTAGIHYFDSDGKMFIPDLQNGHKEIVEENGNRYLTIDGIIMKDGLYELDGEYYFAKYNGTLLSNGSSYVETDYLSGNGWYAFGDDAKLIKSGFVTGDGKTYYYENGVRAKGLTKLNNDYYMFNSGSGMMYKDATLWVGANSYGIESGMYYFGIDGKMIIN